MSRLVPLTTSVRGVRLPLPLALPLPLLRLCGAERLARFDGDCAVRGDLRADTAGRALLSTDRCGVSTLPPLLARLARDAFVSRGPLVGEDCEDGGPALVAGGTVLRGDLAPLGTPRFRNGEVPVTRDNKRGKESVVCVLCVLCVCVCVCV